MNFLPLSSFGSALVAYAVQAKDIALALEIDATARAGSFRRGPEGSGRRVAVNTGGDHRQAVVCAAAVEGARER